MARLASPYPQLLWVLHVSKSALMTDEKYWPIKSAILKSPLILWQLCDFFSRMKYVHLMKRHVPCTVFGVFLCSHSVRFFQHSLFGSVNGDLRYRVVLLNLSRTLTVIFSSEGLIFFPQQILMTIWLEPTVIFCLFHFIYYSTTKNECWSQKTLKGIFKVNFLYIIYCFKSAFSP